MPESESSLVRVVRTGRRFKRRLAVVSDDVASARRRLSVLLVEAATSREESLAGRLGEVAGYDLDVVRATSVEAARAALRRRRFDMHFCDFWLGAETAMPILDSIGPGRERPVVLLAAVETDDIALIGRHAGAAGLVQKSDLSPRAIENVLDTVIPAAEEAARESARARPLDLWLRTLLAAVQRAERSSESLVVDDPDMAALVAELAAEASHLKLGIAAALYELQSPPSAGADRPVLRFDLVPHLDDAARRLSERGGAAVRFVRPELPLLIEGRAETICDCLHALVAEGLALADVAGTIELRPVLSGGAVEIIIAARGIASPRVRPRGLQAAVIRARRKLAAALATAASGGFLLRGSGRGTTVRLALPLRGR